MIKPEIKKLKHHVDDRGEIDQLYNLDLPFQVKRIYKIRPLEGVVRAFHGHRQEQKCFIINKGIVKFIVHKLDGWELEAFVMDRESGILIIPSGYYNGFVALTNDVEIIGFSSKTLDESQKDDYREDPFKFGKNIWRTKDR